MQDFIRIGGEIVSQPLNENFRRLINAISLANTNLIFPEENAIVSTLTDMYAVPAPLDGQACYVISSGELYRYTKRGNGRWVKIADFGNTFRQGFLNSGAVVMAGPIVKTGANELTLPDMLLYYKNKNGDDRYLKGMYGIDSQVLDASSFNTPGVYSIYATMEGTRALPEMVIGAGMPSEDLVTKIYLGSFLVDTSTEIMKDFVFTIPDIAYTGDRGLFYVSGGQANGLGLMPNNNNNKTVNRKDGYYYDEGSNYPTGPIIEYPTNVDNGSNYNLKFFDGQESPTLYYLAPNQGLQHDILASPGLVVNKYWDLDNQRLRDVEEGHFTIQQHLVTPNGQNIVLYGTKVYNSIEDAISNINTVFGSDVNFPYVEATRIVVGSFASFSSSDDSKVRFYSMGRLAQVGTISPIFADNQFTVYNGSALDTTPASIQLNLDDLGEEYDTGLGYYKLTVLPYDAERQLFSLPNKYITDTSVPAVTQTEYNTRNYPSSGYKLADDKDLDYLRDRIANIEAEIWAPYDAQKARYEQSARKRLYDTENRLDADDLLLADHEARITWNEENKVTKTTTINGYTLGDTTGKSEAKAVTLVTGDIQEGAPVGGNINLWYTDARVSANADVSAAKAHVETVSLTDDADDHVKVNPHNLSTDDINILLDTTKIFVTPEEERRIRADRLPENTIQALQDLDDKNMDYLPVTKLGGNRDFPTGSRTLLGNITSLEIFEDGVDFDTSLDGKTLMLNIRGQIDESTMMTKAHYATLEAEYPSLYNGYVDNSVYSGFAYSIAGMEEAASNQYYGTNSEGNVGIHNLPVYVSTVNQGSFASEDQIIFVPTDGSVTEQHLETTLRNKINNNYHSIYDGGVLKSAEINSLVFGNNLSVNIAGHTATINATGSGGQSENKFANLEDVNVTYTGNAGKMLVVNDEENAVVLANTPSVNDFMKKSVYVSTTDLTKVKKAVEADHALLSDSCTNASQVNSKSVNDTDTTISSLWTAAKIISNTSSQIASEGVRTYSGTTTPSSSLGKNGDLYILLES